MPPTAVSSPVSSSNQEFEASQPLAQPDTAPDTASEVSPPPELESTTPSSPEAVVTAQPPAPTPPGSSTTQLQVQTARLVHVQTNTNLELPQHLDVIHMGKPNDMIPPDIDVSGFASSEIVSRIHADIRVEADAFYIEDVGSSNGTYVNNLPLAKGNRHRLRPGDRISLGKGDLMTFLFQLS